MPADLVEITGGEPLLQDDVHVLIERLLDRGRTVLIETSGACDIGRCDPRAIRIMDLKTPGSGEVERNDLENIARLHDRDEVKFVIMDRRDYEWARDLIAEHGLVDRCAAVLMSPVFEQEPGEEIGGARGLEPAEAAADRGCIDAKARRGTAKLLRAGDFEEDREVAPVHAGCRYAAIACKSIACVMVDAVV